MKKEVSDAVLKIKNSDNRDIANLCNWFGERIFSNLTETVKVIAALYVNEYTAEAQYLLNAINNAYPENKWLISTTTDSSRGVFQKRIAYLSKCAYSSDGYDVMNSLETFEELIIINPLHKKEWCYKAGLAAIQAGMCERSISHLETAMQCDGANEDILFKCKTQKYLAYQYHKLFQMTHNVDHFFCSERLFNETLKATYDTTERICIMEQIQVLYDDVTNFESQDLHNLLGSDSNVS
jgi:tetratricopeptide (TPR) repeat protein